MLKIPRTINFNEKLLKILDIEETKKSDPTKNIFEVKKERIAMIIATFEGVIKDLDETPQAACILTCGYYRPSIYTLQLINEYHSTKKVLLTYKKNGNDLKILTNQDSRKLHKDFANFESMTAEAFEFQCKERLKEKVLGCKKLMSIQLNAKANENLVSSIHLLFLPLPTLKIDFPNEKCVKLDKTNFFISD